MSTQQPDIRTADHTEHRLEMAGRWYMVTEDGAATLCADRADAEHEARRADTAWPRMGPHRAVQLVDATATAKLRGQRAVLLSLLRECLPVIDALLQRPGDDESDDRLNNLAGRIMAAQEVIEDEQLQECKA